MFIQAKIGPWSNYQSEVDYPNSRLQFLQVTIKLGPKIVNYGHGIPKLDSVRSRKEGNF